MIFLHKEWKELKKRGLMDLEITEFMGMKKWIDPCGDDESNWWSQRPDSFTHFVKHLVCILQTPTFLSIFPTNTFLALQMFLTNTTILLAFLMFW